MRDDVTRKGLEKSIFPYVWLADQMDRPIKGVVDFDWKM